MDVILYSSRLNWFYNNLDKNWFEPVPTAESPEAPVLGARDPNPS